METLPLITNGIIILICYYLFYFREFILARKEFQCLRCGRCCKLRVRLNKQEIEDIEKAGYTNFLDEKSKNLMRINGYCKFLTLKNGITSCQIQDIKPGICRRFPVGRGLFGKKIDFRCRTCSRKLF